MIYVSFFVHMFCISYNHFCLFVCFLTECHRREGHRAYVLYITQEIEYKNKVKYIFRPLVVLIIFSYYCETYHVFVFTNLENLYYCQRTLNTFSAIHVRIFMRN